MRQLRPRTYQPFSWTEQDGIKFAFNNLGGMDGEQGLIETNFYTAQGPGGSGQHGISNQRGGSGSNNNESNLQIRNPG